MTRKLIVELIGTFFLVFTVGMTVLAPGAGTLAPIAIGTVLMVMVYAGGRISGAHYNPAVSLGVFIRGKMTSAEFILYIIFQLIGGGLAAAATIYLKQGAVAAVTPAALAVGPALLAEFLFTFALVYMVLNVATVDKVAGNSYYGAAIGLTVMAGAFAVGNVSGGAFNPAVAVGITLLHLSAPASLWVLVVGELLGAAVAGGVFLMLNMGDDR